MKNIMTKAIPFILFLGIASVPPTPDASALSALSISGSIDKRLILKVIRMHENEIKYCYNVALMKNKSLNGTVRTVFVILPDGSVNRAVVLSSTLNNPEVEQCVLDHIKTWKFPECKNGSMLFG